MPAERLLDERHILNETDFVEIVVWHVDPPVRASAHSLKYRLALVVDGVCILRYDNEAGKGDHRHSAVGETRYRYQGIEKLLSDFWSDVDKWRR